MNTPDPQVSAFGDELDRLIDRFRDEFDISYAAIVGTLHMKAHLLCEEASALDNEEDEE